MSNPIPWKQAEDAFSIFVEDANGKIIADVRPHAMGMEEHRARANLLAAAPEMLEALHSLDWGVLTAAQIKLVQAAIEKAEGK
jgi:hypothetical protein